MAYEVREKVVTYVTRRKDGRLEVLVFDHVEAPEAGTQVPGGSIDPGETPEAAAHRETYEEAGLTNLKVIKYLGAFPWFWGERRQMQMRHVYQLAAPDPLPEEWVHVVSAGLEDTGMPFRHYWMDVETATAELSGGRGLYLRFLDPLLPPL